MGVNHVVRCVSPLAVKVGGAPHHPAQDVPPRPGRQKIIGLRETATVPQKAP